MSIHIRKKKFKCNQFDKEFSCNSYLMIHIRIYTGERLFKCSQCDNTFPQNPILKSYEDTYGRTTDLYRDQLGQPIDV